MPAQPRQRRGQRHRRGDRRRCSASRSDIENIVLVGNDDQIPFARVRDATVYSNEREYVEGPGVRQTPLTNSLALGYLLTDDPYADATPLAVGSRELFVPDLAIGRLVETPAEIKVALDNYVRFDGRLDPQTALSTGYDFLDDGAEEIAEALRDNELGPNGDGLTTAELRGDTWDSAALDDALTGTATVPAPDIASVNAHFDHFRALPAASDAADDRDRPVHHRRRARRGDQADARAVAAVLDGLPRRPVGERPHRRRHPHQRLGAELHRRRRRVRRQHRVRLRRQRRRRRHRGPHAALRREPRRHDDRRPGDEPGQAAVHLGDARGHDAVRREGRVAGRRCTACRSTASAA